MERAILARWKSLGQKLNMWRKLNMKLFHTLIAGFSLLAAFTATGESTDFRFVDLKSAVNRGFRDETAGDGRGGWFDQGPANDMSGFKSGVRNFSGVPFRIIDPAVNGGRSCVVLRGRNQDALPLDTGAIAVNEKAGAALFLSSCGWNAGIGETVATVTVRFRRAGLYLEIPLRYRMETGPWWNPETPMHGEIAWKGHNRSADIGIYISGWVNPYPDEEIESITISSPNGSALPAILAVTLTNDPKVVASWKERNRKKDTSAADAAGPVRISAPDPAVKAVPVNGKLASLSLGFNRNEPYRLATAHLAAAGQGKPFVRLQINIAEPSPAEGVWDFSKLDEYVDFIQSAGAEPMLCFGPGGPIWMADPNVPGTMSANWRPRIREEYYVYCETILRRYAVERKHPVLWWQIGNETELKGWSYRYYSGIYRELAPRLRRIMPEIRIGGPVTCNPNTGWARELLRENLKEVDFLSYHQYGYSEPFDTPSDFVMSRTVRYREAAEEYRKLAQEFQKNLPVIVSETNTNPRFHNPPGTDPRIRTMFGAAWYASALCQFALGGGDALCFFTLDGGFGACQLTRTGLVLHPVYHAIRLLREVCRGTIVPLVTSGTDVEAYLFEDGNRHSCLIINKSAGTREIELAGLLKGTYREYVLNKKSAAVCRNLTPEGKFPLLPVRENISERTFRMEGYELRLLMWER